MRTEPGFLDGLRNGAILYSNLIRLNAPAFSRGPERRAKSETQSQRSYGTNLNVVDAAKSKMTRALDLLRG